MKLPLVDLNSNPYLPNFTSTYTYGATITLKMLGGSNFYHLHDIKSFLFFSTICYLIAYYCIYIISVSLTVSLISAKMIVKKFYKNKNSEDGHLL